LSADQDQSPTKKKKKNWVALKVRVESLAFVWMIGIHAMLTATFISKVQTKTRPDSVYSGLI
jgi:hypothetical protein